MGSLSPRGLTLRCALRSARGECLSISSLQYSNIRARAPVGIAWVEPSSGDRRLDPCGGAPLRVLDRWILMGKLEKDCARVKRLSLGCSKTPCTASGTLFRRWCGLFPIFHVLSRTPTLSWLGAPELTGAL